MLSLAVHFYLIFPESFYTVYSFSIRLIAWKMIQYLQTSFTSLCFQSKDETDLEILRQVQTANSK